MKILIIGHNVDDVSSIAEGMRGYQTDRASTGWEALAMLQKDLYDMAILDIDLPDGTGHYLIPHIKKNQPNIYIATMTAYNSRDLEKKVRAQGIIYYMVRPFDMNEIKYMLAHILIKKHGGTLEK
jgi:DNA-binding response OmpR family regulator